MLDSFEYFVNQLIKDLLMLAWNASVEYSVDQSLIYPFVTLFNKSTCICACNFISNASLNSRSSAFWIPCIYTNMIQTF